MPEWGGSVSRVSRRHLLRGARLGAGRGGPARPQRARRRATSRTSRETVVSSGRPGGGGRRADRRLAEPSRSPTRSPPPASPTQGRPRGDRDSRRRVPHHPPARPAERCRPAAPASGLRFSRRGQAHRPASCSGPRHRPEHLSVPEPGRVVEPLPSNAYSSARPHGRLLLRLVLDRAGAGTTGSPSASGWGSGSTGSP